MNKFTYFLLLSFAFLGITQAAEPSNENENLILSQEKLALLKGLFVKPFKIDSNGEKIFTDSEKFFVSIPGIEQFLADHFPNYELPENQLHGPYIHCWGLAPEGNQEIIYLKNNAIEQNNVFWIKIDSEKNIITLSSTIVAVKNKLIDIFNSQSPYIKQEDFLEATKANLQKNTSAGIIVKYYGQISGLFPGAGTFQVKSNPYFINDKLDN